MKSFIARLIVGNRITIPKDVVEEMKLSKGKFLKVEILEVIQ